MAQDYLQFDNYKIIEQVPSVIDSEYVRDEIVGIKCPKCKERIPVPSPPDNSYGFLGLPVVCDFCGLTVQRNSYGLMRCSTDGPYVRMSKQEVKDIHEQPKKSFWRKLADIIRG